MKWCAIIIDKHGTYEFAQRVGERPKTYDIRKLRNIRQVPRPNRKEPKPHRMIAQRPDPPPTTHTHKRAPRHHHQKTPQKPAARHPTPEPAPHPPRPTAAPHATRPRPHQSPRDGSLHSRPDAHASISPKKYFPAGDFC